MFCSVVNLSKNTKYTISDQTGEREIIKGKFVDSSIVNVSGKVENVKVLLSPHSKISDDVIEVINKLKTFAHAKCNGKPIAVMIFYTVNFTGDF